MKRAGLLFTLVASLLFSCAGNPSSSSSSSEGSSFSSDLVSINDSSSSGTSASVSDPSSSSAHTSVSEPSSSESDPTSEEEFISFSTPSSSESEEESSESSISSEESTLNSSSDVYLTSDSSSQEEAGTLLLDENNGKITGSYETTEETTVAEDGNGNFITLGYVNCMTSTTANYKFAQMKKSIGKIYNKTPLDLRSIKVGYSSTNNVKLEASTEANFGRAVTIIAEASSGTTYTISNEYSYFRVSALGGAVYVSYIEVTYGGDPVIISEDSSNSSSYDSSSSSESISVDPEDYYGSISDTATGAELKTQLHNLIKGHTDKGYNFAYSAYPYTDTDENGKIIDMYSSYQYDAITDHQGAPGKGNYDAEGQMFNREHTIPQSVIGGSPMKSDLHHLLPTDAYVNNRRSNYPHAEVTDVIYTSSNGCKLGTSNVEGYSGKAFEVPDEYKGDIARIYFYMVTRYQDKVSSWSYASFAQNTYPSLSNWAISLYLSWHDMDPVSEKEINRNNAVYSYQNNRNPFVDCPEYVHRIWQIS